jgi:hypothetical protein
MGGAAWGQIADPIRVQNKNIKQFCVKQKIEGSTEMAGK